MAVKNILIFITILVFVEILAASPTRRQYIVGTESSASVSPVTNDGTEWDDNDDDFDVDDEGWYNQVSVSPSPAPDKAQEYNEYDDYSHGNVMVEFGEDDEDQDDDDDDDEQIEQDAEEDENGKNDSEFLFVTPKDTRLMLEDDDSDQSGPIKVRHTGRNSYPRMSEGDISLDSSDEDDKDDSKHQYEFTIDEDDKVDNDDDDTDDDDDDEKEDDNSHKDDESVEVLPRPEARTNDDDEDDLISEGDDDDNDMFDNPEEDAAEVIYGDHVFLY